MITAIRAIKRLSTALLSIFLENILPRVLPTTAHTIIIISIGHSKVGTVLVARDEIREKSWEKNMMKRDARAEFLVSREKI